MHASKYNRLNYGKDMQSRASCYITCSCQSRLSVNDLLDYANNLALKTALQLSRAIASLGQAHLSLEVLSLFSLSLSSINSLTVGKTSDSYLPP